MNWDNVGKRRLTPEQEAEIVRQRQELAKLYSAVFGTKKGKELLRHFRRITKDRFIGADAPERALYQLEGQRQFVHDIETLCAKGRDEHPDQLRADLAEATAPQSGG